MRLIPLDGFAWSDARGWGTLPLKAAGVDVGRVAELHVVSVEPGAVRGDHLHPNVTEWLLLFGARLTFAWREEGGPVDSITVSGHEPVLAEIPPGVAHTVRCDGPGTAFLFSWADGEPETRRVEPLLG